MALVRKAHGFQRYVFSVQYNGSPFLGFSYQGAHGENCITSQGKDLRNLFSVEGKIRLALTSLASGNKLKSDRGDIHTVPSFEAEDLNFENIQVSSRTDRGVHALKNTFHVDIRSRPMREPWNTRQLLRGMNYHLSRTLKTPLQSDLLSSLQRNHSQHNLLSGNEIRITTCKLAPKEMMKNKHYNPDSDEQPSHISWNARFSATSRIYVYRILTNYLPGEDETLEEGYGIPFEDNWSWKIHTSKDGLNLYRMREAASILVGKHDFSSFRGKNCSRSSPVVTVEDIKITSVPLLSNFIGMTSFDQTLNDGTCSSQSYCSANLVTIMIRGDAFLYRQVRNLVGCLVEVGKEDISPKYVRDVILPARDRSKAGTMAPAHGLYLANVSHRGLLI